MVDKINSCLSLVDIRYTWNQLKSVICGERKLCKILRIPTCSI